MSYESKKNKYIVSLLLTNYFHSSRKIGEGLSRGLYPALHTALRGNRHAEPPRRPPLADLSSPLIHSGSLREGAALVGGWNDIGQPFPCLVRQRLFAVVLSLAIF